MAAALQNVNIDEYDNPLDHLEKLKAANRRLESFAQIASHDLRSPLRAMMSIAEWVREDIETTFGKVPEQINSDLMELQEQGRRMGKLLQDLLHYSQVGFAGNAPHAFEARSVIQDCVDICAVPEGMHVRVGQEMPNVACSPVEFGLVVRNLISNAVKYHDRSDGEIAIDGWSEGGQAWFRVRDDGPGIAPELAEDVFGMFRTLDSRRGNGIGLGLVRRITDEYGGSSKVLPNPGGRGSDFIVSLPLAAGADDRNAQAGAAPGTSGPDDGADDAKGASR